MKKIIATIIVVTIAVTTFAQENINIGGYDKEIKTLFKKGIRDGFYGSVSVGYSPIDKQDGITFSSRGGWIMDHWFAFGLAGTGFANNVDEMGDYTFNPNTNEDLNLAGGYGGFFLEPMLMPLKPIHLSFPVLFGIGAATSFNNYYSSSYYEVGDMFWVVEPGVELEVNFTRWLRVAAFATYRYTPDITIKDIAPDALRSYSTGLTIKVGLF